MAPWFFPCGAPNRLKVPHLQWGSLSSIEGTRTGSIVNAIKCKATNESIEPVMKGKQRAPFPAGHADQVHGLAFHGKAIRSQSYEDTLTGPFWTKTQVRELSTIYRCLLPPPRIQSGSLFLWNGRRTGIATCKATRVCI